MGMPLHIHKKNCLSCKKNFETFFIRKKFCSKQCIFIYGKIKLLNDKKNNPQKYVERNIKYRENKNKKLNNITLKNRIYICNVCKKEFIPGYGEQKYCSNNCRNINATQRASLNWKNNKNYLNKRWNDWYKKSYKTERGKEGICIICNNKFIKNSKQSKYCKNVKCRLKYVSQKSLKRYHQNSKQIMEKRKNNLNEMIKLKLRMRIKSALKSTKSIKSDKTMNLIGCSIEYLKQYIQEQFKEGMNWSNYNFYGWHLDHIIPCSKFNLIIDEEQRKCFHYLNLQPLWCWENWSKHNKVNINANDKN